MITIDGSEGEGGGQSIRTAIGLSVLTKEPFKIINIRANRPEKGLKEQHLQAVESVKRLCNAEVKGLKLGSEELEFIPNEITKKRLKVEIRTAGSISLVLQALLIASLKNRLVIDINGGATFGKWAPSVPYTKEILLYYLKNIGYNVDLDIKKHGFYPTGNGEVEVRVKGSDLRGLDLSERGEFINIKGVSYASEMLMKSKVAERQADRARNILSRDFDIPINISNEYVRSLSPGSGILIYIDCGDCLLGFDAVGEKGKQSEKIGEECSIGLINQTLGNATLDEFMSDQILPFLSVAKDESVINVAKLTEHCKTNINVIKKFLDCEFKIDGNNIKIKPGRNI